MVRMSMMRRTIFYFMCLILICARVSAQQIQVEVPDEVEAGRPFSISYVVKDTDRDDIKIGEQPSFSGLELLYGPATSKSSSVRIINGRVSSSSSITYTYTLLSSSKGSFTISGFSLLIGGKTVVAPSRRIQALEVARQQSANTGYSISNKQYHYIASVGKRSVYEQEALPITYKLYAQSSINLVDTKAPVYDGFISHNLKTDNARSIMREEYQGSLYNTVEMYKELIYPQRTGRLKIPVNQITIQVPLEVDDDPFLGQLIDKTLSTKSIEIEVKPLPEEGKPQSFSGAVGDFSVSMSIDTDAPKTNEAFTMRYILKGYGNLKMARLSEVVFPKELDVYPPADHTKEAESASGILETTRILEYSVIPRHTGEYTLPSLSFSYFDPKLAQYRTIQTEPKTISVGMGKNIERNEEVISSHDTSDRMTYSFDYNIGTTEPWGLSYVLGWLYPLSYIVIAFVMFILGFWIKRELALRSDVWGYGASRANAVAQKRLRVARKYSEEGRDNEFYEEALNAMWEYVGSKLKLPSSELNRTKVVELLEAHGLSSERISEWKRIMDDIEFARFAPSRDDLQPMVLYQKAADIIAYIEKSI